MFVFLLHREVKPSTVRGINVPAPRSVEGNDSVEPWRQFRGSALGLGWAGRVTPEKQGREL